MAYKKISELVAKTVADDTDLLILSEADASKHITVANFTAGIDGLPAGGTTSQVLAKIDATDGNATWVNASSGSAIETLTYYSSDNAGVIDGLLSLTQGDLTQMCEITFNTSIYWNWEKTAIWSTQSSQIKLTVPPLSIEGTPFTIGQVRIRNTTDTLSGGGSGFSGDDWIDIDIKAVYTDANILRIIWNFVTSWTVASPSVKVSVSLDSIETDKLTI